MDTQDTILCISAGLLTPKKADTPVARLNRYLNYGLLGLATVLQRRGYAPVVVHGGFEEPKPFVDTLHDRGLLSGRGPVLLSLPSSFALPWARAACTAIRTLSPDARIIVGGRWVVANDFAWIRSQLPKADTFVGGLAEDRIEQIIAAEPGTAFATSSPHELIPSHNYRLLDRREEFQPSIEISRGCGMHCAYCAEGDVPASDMKAPQRVIEELAELEELGGEATPYLEASIFRPSTAWINEFRNRFAARRFRIRWRTESRVDTMPAKHVAALAAAGLRVLDLGLESGSPEQLRAMRKTPRPGVYLAKASELLRACHDHGVWPKLNILIYPGETRHTLQQTAEWLEEHRRFIKGLSVGPTILYRYGRSTAAIMETFKGRGAAMVDPASLDALGYAHLHMSSDVDHDAAVAFSLELSRDFMSSRDYYDLKSFSYFSPGLTWQDFRKAVVNTPATALPFHGDHAANRS